MDIQNLQIFARLVLEGVPTAKAVIRGGELNNRIGGTVYLYPAGNGTLVVAEIFGLPRHISKNGKQEAAGPFYAFHVHEGYACGNGSGGEPFADTLGHYNPADEAHPLHTGDMPQLLSDKGYAFSAFFTPRFTPEQVMGRTIVIHQHADDFHTQPSGNSGTKIACGRVTEAYE